MRTPRPSMRPATLPVRLVAVLMFLTTALTGLLVAGSVAAASAATAGRDTATVYDGSAVAINVLANDRYSGAPKVTILNRTPGLTVSVGRGNVVYASPARGMKPGSYGVKYRLVAGGRHSDNWIAVTVRATTAVAVKDAVNLEAGGRHGTVDVLANDTYLGAAPRLSILVAPPHLSTSVANNRIYVAAKPEAAGQTNLGVKYRLTVGHRYADAWISVPIVNGPVKVLAERDAATLAAGGAHTSVDVLANDRYAGGIPTLSVVIASTEVSAEAGNGRIYLRAKPEAAGKTGLGVKYRVTVGGHSSEAWIALTITGAVTPPPPPVQPPAANSALLNAIDSLPVATERRTGYDRDLFKHWTDADRNGCDTRREVLIAEATVRPGVGSGCAFTGGSWTSYYDGVTTTNPSTFDIDHMVPLAEAWDSGANAWSAARREAFANDLGDARSLVAVTATSNRSKSDQDPAEWLPARNGCRYVSEWVAVKVRWSLTVDSTEKTRLRTYVTSACPSQGYAAPSVVR